MGTAVLGSWLLVLHSLEKSILGDGSWQNHVLGFREVAANPQAPAEPVLSLQALGQDTTAATHSSESVTII